MNLEIITRQDRHGGDHRRDLALLAKLLGLLSNREVRQQMMQRVLKEPTGGADSLQTRTLDLKKHPLEDDRLTLFYHPLSNIVY